MRTTKSLALHSRKFLISMRKRISRSAFATICSVLIVAGMAFVAYANQNTTTIGQNISTGGNLQVGGNATTTGNQVISGNLDVSGTSTLTGTILGTSLDYTQFTSTGVMSYNGSARPARYIWLDMNLATVCGSACGGTGVDTVTNAHDQTNNRNYVRFNSATAAQSDDLVFDFIIPDDFSSFTTSDSVSIDVRASDTYSTSTMTLYDGSGNADGTIDGVTITPSIADTWQSKTSNPSSNYTAGDIVHLHIRVSNGMASGTVDIARIFITYLAKN